jgi:hypothetical protein
VGLETRRVQFEAEIMHLCFSCIQIICVDNRLCTCTRTRDMHDLNYIRKPECSPEKKKDKNNSGKIKENNEKMQPHGSHMRIYLHFQVSWRCVLYFRGVFLRK